MNMKKTNQKGFTIIELMIASAVFSTILLLTTYGLIYIGRLYYKSVTTARTQEVARTVMDDIAQAIQFSGKDPVNLPPNFVGVRAVCIGGHRYSFRLGIKQNDAPGRRVLVSDKNVDCGPGIQPLPIASDPAINSAVDPRSFLTDDMRIAALTVTAVDAENGLYSVHVRVVSGDYDLLTPTPANASVASAADVQCRNDTNAGQFCAVADLSTVVQKRIN